MADYQNIGVGYQAQRRADPRIALQIRHAIGDANKVLNIGAGTGNYEPSDCDVVAIEPSWVMIGQRAKQAGPAVRGVAESLPFRDGTFDVAMATLTLHHWRNLEAGIAEMQRVSARQVIMLFDACMYLTWMTMEYYPEIAQLQSERDAPSAEEVLSLLRRGRSEIVEVPRDCTDGFGGAFWARPEAYLDPVVQAGMSSFAQLTPHDLELGNDRLRNALESGEWDHRFGELRTMESNDLGYRLIVT